MVKYFILLVHMHYILKFCFKQRYFVLISLSHSLSECRRGSSCMPMFVSKRTDSTAIRILRGLGKCCFSLLFLIVLLLYVLCSYVWNKADSALNNVATGEKKPDVSMTLRFSTITLYIIFIHWGFRFMDLYVYHVQYKVKLSARYVCVNVSRAS